MISILVSRGHEYTVAALAADANAPNLTALPYNQAIGAKALPKATYIFTDFDRLSTGDLTEAARLYRRLQEGGCRVLNDPARVRTRTTLLRGLHREGINSFNIYSAEKGDRPERFPVFLRVADGHGSPLTDLVYEQETLERAIEAAVAAGFPRQSLIVVEYAAQPIRPGLFRKLSVFRVADRYLPHVCVHEPHWIVKSGRMGVAPEDLYDEELEIMRDNRFAEPLKQAFELAQIEFGRADFGLVDGRPCIYEINTNPTIGAPGPHPFRQRVESMTIWWEELLSALRAIDTSEGDVASSSIEEIGVAGGSVAAMRQATTIFPAMQGGFYRLSVAEADSGDDQSAIRSARRAIEDTPEDVKALCHLSKLLEQQGQLDEALSVADRAIELAPSDTEPLYVRATALKQAGRLSDALTTMTHAIALHPKWHYFWLLSRINVQLGDSAAAIEAAERSLALCPEDVKPLAEERVRNIKRSAALRKVWRALPLTRYLRHPKFAP